MTKSETPKNNNTILYGIIIVLLLVIVAMGGYFLGTQQGGNTNTPAGNTVANATGEGITVTIIDDTRCTTCQTSTIVDSIKQVPFLAQATFETKDFADEGVEAYIKENNITTLPAVIFSTNALADGGQMVPYLTVLPDSQYSLQVGSTFDPFVTRSEKWFLVLEGDTLENIKTGGYIQGNPEAKITWIEYSELECPFCAKLHNSTTPEELKEKYGDDLNLVFQHYPLDFHQNAKPGAEILECLGAQNGGDAFYSLIDISYASENSTKTFLIEEAVKLGADQVALEACLDAGTYSDKVDSQLQTGQTVFGVTGTPGNVLINNETGEYEVISGAYPTDNFVQVIDRLLQ